MKSAESPKAPTKLRPCISPEADQNQLISLSVDAAKQIFESGNPPVSLVLHYLKLADPTEELRREALRKEIALKEAKIKSLESQARVEELYAEAMRAMQRYGGYGEEENNEPPY